MYVQQSVVYYEKIKYRNIYIYKKNVILFLFLETIVDRYYIIYATLTFYRFIFRLETSLVA